MTIPARDIVQVNPSVLSAGGRALVANGLFLSTDAATPIGSVLPFASAPDVAAYYGPLSPEAVYAGIYFNGYDNATLLPARLFIAPYNTAAQGGYLRSASLAGMTLTQLQALTGVLTINVSGVPKTSSAINLAAATSFSNAATIIQAAFAAPGFTVTYDGQRNAFLFTNTATGVTATMSYATGTLSTGLRLTAATSAVLSAGAAVAVPAAAMEAIAAITQNWVGFMTTFEPSLADKQAFAAWVVSKSNRFVYYCWDTDVNAIVANNTTAFGPLMLAASASGVVPIYQDPKIAALFLAIMASIDFNRLNGRLTFAFKSQAGLTASVTDQTTANILEANGYNFYGAYATANDGFTFAYPGSMAGQYKFVDAFVNQVYLNSQLQLALLSLLTSVVSIPYNPQGYALIDAACLDPINQAVNFGSIRANVPLSASQAAQVNNAAGLKIDDTLATRGWYLQINPATAQVRAARGTPPMTLWYMDGGAVQRMVLASILVQ